MNIQGTVTGRAQLALPNVEDLPRGCYYMTTTNRTQLEAAIRSVDEDGTTVIDAVNERGKNLCDIPSGDGAGWIKTSCIAIWPG